MLFPVKLPLRIDWSDLDLFGHVNNVAYFRYIQASRINYWQALGLGSSPNGNAVGPILASTQCRFLEPLFFPGNIVIEASLAFMKTTSFGLHHRILNEQGTIVAQAEDLIVLYDFSSHQKTPIPTELRQLAEEIEGRKI